MPQIIYRWLALLALAGTLLAFGWVKGASHVQAKADALSVSAHPQNQPLAADG